MESSAVVPSLQLPLVVVLQKGLDDCEYSFVHGLPCCGDGCVVVFAVDVVDSFLSDLALLFSCS